MMNSNYIDERGRLMRGGNSSSSALQEGYRRLSSNAVLNEYAKDGGKFGMQTGSGRSMLPTYTDRWTGETRFTKQFEDAAQRGLSSLSPAQSTGTGYSGAGLAQIGRIDRAAFDERRDAAIARAAEMEALDMKLRKARESVMGAQVAPPRRPASRNEFIDRPGTPVRVR